MAAGHGARVLPRDDVGQLVTAVPPNLHEWRPCPGLVPAVHGFERYAFPLGDVRRAQVPRGGLDSGCPRDSGLVHHVPVLSTVNPAGSAGPSPVWTTGR